MISFQVKEIWSPFQLPEVECQLSAPVAGDECGGVGRAEVGTRAARRRRSVGLRFVFLFSLNVHKSHTGVSDP